MSETGGLFSYTVGTIDAGDPIPLHLLPQGCGVGSDGALWLRGQKVSDLAREFGSPLFIYDEEQIRARARELKEHFGGDVAYASKAFLCKAMAKLVADEGLHIDVASGGELSVALSAGFPADRIVMHGNNKSLAELKLAILAGVGRIVIDSFDEIDRLEELVSEKRPVKVWIRVTPGVEAHTHMFVMTGQHDSKFGFGLMSGDAEIALDRLTKSKKLELVGLHAHIGSQIFSLESFVKEVEVLAPFFTSSGLEELNFGGGLGIPYISGEPAVDFKDWAHSLKESARASGIPDTARIMVEPGRSLVGPAAITVYEVGTVKEIEGIRTYVSVDGGMSDNPRPVLYDSGYEVFKVDDVLARRDRRVTIVGKHCESGDILVKDGQLPVSTKVGDYVATPVTGAYGYSMASNYNKVGRPAVLFVNNNGYRLVLRRETVSDMLALDVD
ncbi:MAG: diaminopimelate decarboxylase [Acidimicrobiaceae bacterium]|nr:diaminopimelate decarboxylase [Acidimicrobiaceae bacterium]